VTGFAPGTPVWCVGYRTVPLFQNDIVRADRLWFLSPTGLPEDRRVWTERACLALGRLKRMMYSRVKDNVGVPPALPGRQ
jgi:hypothetical protein